MSRPITNPYREQLEQEIILFLEKAEFIWLSELRVKLEIGNEPKAGEINNSKYSAFYKIIKKLKAESKIHCCEKTNTDKQFVSYIYKA